MREYSPPLTHDKTLIQAGFHPSESGDGMGSAGHRNREAPPRQGENWAALQRASHIGRGGLWGEDPLVHEPGELKLNLVHCVEAQIPYEPALAAQERDQSASGQKVTRSGPSR